MLYAKLCVMAIDLFSRNYFKEHFFLPFLELIGKFLDLIRSLLAFRITMNS
jgi:hypothetical protein